MKIEISEKQSKILFWSSIGCFALNYLCWNIVNALTYLSLSSPTRFVIEDILGAAWGLSFSAGFALFPVGLCLCKRTWRLPAKFFTSMGMSLIIALFMTAVFPEKEVLGGPEWQNNTLLEEFLRNVSLILFLQMALQTILLMVVHCFTYERDKEVSTKTWWRDAGIALLTFGIWLWTFVWAANYLHSDC